MPAQSAPLEKNGISRNSNKPKNIKLYFFEIYCLILKFIVIFKLDKISQLKSGQFSLQKRNGIHGEKSCMQMSDENWG
jgi:hypothetical protein